MSEAESYLTVDWMCFMKFGGEDGGGDPRL